MKQLSIMGLGLMGASLAQAARRRGLAERVHGYARREETRRAAVAAGMVDAAFDDPAAAVAGADLVVFCVPILSMAPLAQACRGGWTSGCVVTDVGSTKVEVCASMAAALSGSGAVFVGSHPIAGSDETGLEAAREDLYEGAVTVVTPRPETPHAAVEAVSRLWQGVGSEVVARTPAEHDVLLAATSHLPHLAAAALIARILDSGAADRGRFCGSGFRDTTRVAGGSEAVWDDIVRTNREALARELSAFGDEVNRLAEWVRRGEFSEVRNYLARSRALRRAWRQPGGKGD